MSKKKYIDMDVSELDKCLKTVRIAGVFCLVMSLFFMWFALFDQYPAIFFTIIFLCLSIFFFIDIRHLSMLKYFKRKEDKNRT